MSTRVEGTSACGSAETMLAVGPVRLINSLNVTAAELSAVERLESHEGFGQWLEYSYLWRWWASATLPA